MFLMSWSAKIFTLVFLIFSMLSIGMETTKGDVIALLKSGSNMLRLLLANFVVVPLLGIILVRSISLAPGVATAFLLLCRTPGGISALHYTSKAKGELFFAGSSAFIMSLLAVFISPLLLAFALPQNAIIIDHYGWELLFIVIFMLLPLALGSLIRHRWDLFAKKIARPFAIASLIAFVIAVWLIADQRRTAMRAIGPDSI
jgi:BASS family bile acid:Na+ symporter